ncbi:hypothetical protein [Endozoicomonas sp. Mp262]|uniref:hypothetical protein n=1 Tax=Endozoicomonas sp. Mp262 TaxID=2919499 RepID=UPI0021D86798
MMVYATAGMRMKEAEYPEASKTLWQSIRETLRHKVQSTLPEHHILEKLEARTITGYEEGAYAWLSVRLKDHTNNNDFGLLELGGASAQIVFPCQTCKESVSTILVEGQPVKLFSHSFLGLGQNLAVKSVLKHPLDEASPCSYGAGKNDENWAKLSCSNDIRIVSHQNIYDPYNYTKTGQRGKYRHIPDPDPMSKNFQWFLAGAFSYMQKDDIDNFCRDDKSAYMPETACFRAIYQHKLLQTLEIADAAVSDSSWTFGAAVCTDTHCMDNSVKLQCKWLPGECLWKPKNPEPGDKKPTFLASHSRGY